MYRIICLIILLTCPILSQQKLHILFSGGIHGYLNSDAPAAQGDIQRIAHAVDSLKRAAQLTDDSFLLFDTGDALSYHYLSKIDSGRTVLRQMIEAGYSGLVPGNLDFKFGSGNLINLNSLDERFSIFATNIVQHDSLPFLTQTRIYHRNGLKIGVIGVVSETIQESISPVRIMNLSFAEWQSPLNKLVSRLKREGCDLVIALGHLNSGEAGELAKQVDGIDLVIGHASGNEKRITKIYGMQNELRDVIIRSSRSATSLGHLELSFHDDGAARRLSDAVLHTFLPVKVFRPSNADRLREERIQSAYSSYSRRKFDGLDPDEQLISMEGNLRQPLIDFMLYSMLKSTRSEIALINDGNFRFSGTSETRPALTVRDIEQLNWADDNLVIMRLTGRAIQSILDRGARNELTGSGKHINYLSIGNHASNPGSPFNIHGQRIAPDEVYAVVTTGFLAQGGDGYPEFNQGTHRRSIFAVQDQGRRIIADPSGVEISLSEVVVHYLHSAEPVDFQYLNDWLQENAFMNRPLWKLNIDRVDIAFTGVKVNNNEKLLDVADSRVNAGTENLLNLTTAGNVYLTRRTRSTRWRNGVLMNYAWSKTGNGDLEETEDNLEFESVLDLYSLARLLNFPDNINIFSGLRFDTEVTAPGDGGDNPRQQDLYASAGFSYNGEAVRELRIGGIGKYDFIEASWNSGVEMNIKFDFRLGSFGLNNGLRARYLLNNPDPAPGDEQHSLDFFSSLAIPLSDNVQLKPQFNIFRFHDKVVDETATNTRYSINLSYSRVWKPQYLRFFRQK